MFDLVLFVVVLFGGFCLWIYFFPHCLGSLHAVHFETAEFPWNAFTAFYQRTQNQPHLDTVCLVTQFHLSSSLII